MTLTRGRGVGGGGDLTEDWHVHRSPPKGRQPRAQKVSRTEIWREGSDLMAATAAAAAVFICFSLEDGRESMIVCE